MPIKNWKQIRPSENKNKIGPMIIYITVCDIINPQVRHGSAEARLLGLRVRIPSGAWISVSRECCVLLGTGLCDGPITRAEESYRERERECVCVCVSSSVIQCNKELHTEHTQLRTINLH